MNLDRTKIMIASNTAWSIYNFRSGLIRALLVAGYEVVAVAPPDEYAKRIVSLGCRFVPLPMDNKGTHPGRDLLLLWRFYGLMRREKVGIFLGYTIKPNIYGSIAARALRIPVINNIPGLGAVFIHESWLTKLVRLMYRIALSRSFLVFFLNEDDRSLFIDQGLVKKEKAYLLPGEGIDLKRFSPVPYKSSNPIRFLLSARMLWDKGVGEFVEAARILRQRGIAAECCLLGFLDVQNPAAISRAQMEAWVAEGAVRYLGTTDDVRAEIAAADCVVLPSYYREGIPRTLLEAAAMARPIITTDAVGCREVVEDGVNGFLCRPRDAQDLAEKMARIVAMSPEARAAMGQRGREKVEREFDERIVIERYLATIAQLDRAQKGSHLPVR